MKQQSHSPLASTAPALLRSSWLKFQQCYARIEGTVKRVFRVVPKKVWVGVGILVLAVCVIGFQNYRADTQLHTAQKADNTSQYTQAQKKLSSINQFAVWPSVRRSIRSEQKRNQQLLLVQQELDRVRQLLSEHQTKAAQQLLKSINKQGGSSSALQTQATQLQNTISSQSKASSGTRSSGSSSLGGSGQAGGGSGGNPGGSGGGSGGSPPPPPPPGPLTSISVTSFTASSSAATASTCNINDGVTFSTNGSGSVTTTWSLLSDKSISEINNPTTYTFSAAGSKSDSFYFNGTQGLESGDSYRVSVTITSVSNPSISATAGPIDISTCAAPPPLAAEQETPIMTTITPGTPSVYETQDNIFPNECSVQVTTPYSVNGAGTVEAIVMATSNNSIGYTYYDNGGVTGFTGSSSTNDTSYFRLPHLPGGGSYSIKVKLVEVSSPSTVYAETSSMSSACD